MTNQMTKELADTAIGVMSGIVTKYADGTIALPGATHKGSYPVAYAEYANGETIVKNENLKTIYRRNRYNQEEFRI